MRKIQTIISIITFALAIVIYMSLGLNASSPLDTISNTEAQELVINAYRLSRGARAYIRNNPILDDIQKAITVNLEEYSLPPFGYFKVMEENLPGGSYDNMREIARSVYTEEVAPYAYKYSPLYKFSYDGFSPDSVPQTISLNNCSFKIDGIGNHYPLFYTDENGELFASVYLTQVPFSFDLISAESDNKLVDAFDDSDVELVIIDGDQHSATAQVSFIWSGFDNIPPFDIQTVECKFVKTSVGWRINESEFSVLCATSSKDTLAAYRASVSPSTADPAFDSFVILPVISFACLVPAVCLLRRRRRNRPVA